MIMSWVSEGLQVDRGGLAAFVLQLVAELLAFVQAAQARALDRGDVHEHILAAIFGLDESIPFRGVEPLHSAVLHTLVPQRTVPVAGLPKHVPVTIANSGVG